MKISYNNWFCCQLNNGSVELCKIKPVKGAGTYSIITYYDGKEQFSGSLADCKNWIETHWIERRYLEEYGKH